jgi:hypothetical protein
MCRTLTCSGVEKFDLELELDTLVIDSAGDRDQADLQPWPKARADDSGGICRSPRRSLR